MQERELTDLSINSRSTVQPNSLLRLGVFTPIANHKRKSTDGKIPSRALDLTEDLRELSIAKREGYEQVKIVGARLNFDTDFRVWCGIVWAVHSYGKHNGVIELPFSEFAHMCGFKAKRVDSYLRTRIDESLTRLMTQVLSFYSEHGGVYKGGLISNAQFCTEIDMIRLTADPQLWELYCVDRQVLLQLKAIEKLPRNEVAQCLYAYINALPTKPHPLSFKRIRERLQLSATTTKEQNRSIRAAIKKLIDIGYLQGSIVKKGKESYLMIESRSPALELLD